MVHAEVFERIVDLVGHVVGAASSDHDLIDPLLDRVTLFFGDAQHVRDEPHRKGGREVLDDVDLVLLEHVVDQLGDDLAGSGFHLAHLTRREAGRHEGALLAVLLTVLVDHARVRRDVRSSAFAVDEGLGVTLDRDDVVVAEHLPDLVFCVPVERLVLEEVVVHLVRIVVRRGRAEIDIDELRWALVFQRILRISAEANITLLHVN